MTEAEKPEVKEQAPSGRLLSLVGHLDAAYQSLLLARIEAKELNLNHSLEEIYHALNYIEGAKPGDMPND